MISSEEELKGSLEALNEKWDNLIKRVEEVKDLTNRISIQCKEIIHIIDEHEKDKNE